MSDLKVKISPDVAPVFDNYPDHVRDKMTHLRNLIVDTASAIDGITSLEETLKWGEPSYLAKKGSTIRIDWKKKKPDQYAIYFSCSSRLVETFRIVYRDTFEFEGNRAIVFQLNDPLPKDELKKCLIAGLTYHKIKQLPLLGL